MIKFKKTTKIIKNPNVKGKKKTGYVKREGLNGAMCNNLKKT
jgi:hypothetical protein